MSSTTPRQPSTATVAPAGLAWNLGSAVLPLLGSFLVSVLIAPYLGPSGFGEYMTTMSAATLLLILGKFGVHAATSRLLTENEDDPGPWLRAGLWLRSTFTAPVVLLSVGLGPLLGRALGGEDLSRPFLVLGPVVLAASYYEFGTEAMVGLSRFRGVLVVRIAYLALRMGAIAWVRLGQLGSTAFLAGHATAQTLPTVAMIAALLRRTRRRPGAAAGARPPAGQDLAGAMRRTFDVSLPLAFSSASFLVYAHTDRLMIARFIDQATVGQFGVARNVLDASLFPLFALTWSLRPALVVAVRAKDGAVLRSTVSTGLRWSFLYAVAAPALLLVFGPPLLVSLYSPAYAEAGRLLLWMLPILFLRGIGTIIFPALLAADAQGAYARLMVGTATVNVLANLALIPWLGARGAVLATILSLLLLTAGGLGQVRRSLGALPWGRDGKAHATALGISLAVAWLAHRWLPRSAGLPVLVVAALGCAVLILGVSLGGRIRRPFA